MKKLLLAFFAAVVAGVFLWMCDVALQIERQSDVDEARPADVIVVLGAAEYRGHPSPVLEARLNHALYLYLKHYAPYVLTTGGAGGEDFFTEGDVGRAYLSRRGVPSEAILVEPAGESTAESIAAAAEIMHQKNLHSAVIVSDGYHIFRVKHLLASQGIAVYGSPRPSQPTEGLRRKWICFRQAVAYGLWRIGVNI